MAIRYRCSPFFSQQILAVLLVLTTSYHAFPSILMAALVDVKVPKVDGVTNTTAFQLLLSHVTTGMIRIVQ